MKARIHFSAVAAICLAALICMTGCSDYMSRSLKSGDSPFEKNESDISSDESSEVIYDEYVSDYNGAQGSAGSLRGRTILVSIVTDDAETSWDVNSDEDNQMIYDTLDNLRISTEYLTEQAARYDSDAEFIWDWELCPDLYYTASFEQSLVTEYGDMYDVQKEWIENNVDTATLKNKYRADNVIYLFFFNTDFSNQVNPWYLGYSCSPDYYIEFCNIYVRFDDVFVTKPPTYAHEMMHCFGAHDLYYSNEFISQKYVDHLTENYSNDIMFTVYDSKTISNDFTDLDAYYVGLLDNCKDVRKWHLAKSEHLSD